jgi:sulfur carrier protein ThiS
MNIQLEINGTGRQVDCAPGTLLSDLLRSLNLCDEDGHIVLLDGELVRSDLALAAQAHGRRIVTVDILGDNERLRFLSECVPGDRAQRTALLLQAQALLVSGKATDNLSLENDFEGIADAVPADALRELLQRLQDEAQPLTGGRTC